MKLIFYIFIILIISATSIVLAAEDYHSIAMEAKKRELEIVRNVIESQNINSLHKPLSSILIFVSFSMPEKSLEAYLRDAHTINASVVIRGLIDNSFQKTFQRIAVLVKSSDGAGVELNPLWFKRFGIDRVPAVVVVPNGSGCFNNQSCQREKDFDVMTGDITLRAALYEIREKGQLTKDLVQTAIQKLQGSDDA